MTSTDRIACESEDEKKPSFQGSLDHLIARPPPTRQSRRLSERRTPEKRKATSAVKTEAIETSFDAGLDITAGQSRSTFKSKAQLRVASSPSKVKREENIDPDFDVGSLAGVVTPTGIVSSTSGSGKKRKVYDEKQFEGMKGIPDRIAPDLDILFCGINPGVRSSEEGFHYAHPSNRFYRILHESGLTPYKLKPSESPDMPQNYQLGLTDLVLRCTARADQVPSMEFQAGATVLLRKLIRYRPKMVCFVGMDVYRQFRKHFASVPGVITSSKGKTASSASQKSSPTTSPSKSPNKRSSSDVQLGLQSLVLSIGVEHGEEANTIQRTCVRLFVIPSTSGLAAGYSDADRISYLQEARSIIATIRSSPLAEGTSYDLLGESIVVNAEDFLEDKIEKLASGQWAHVAKKV